MPMSWEMREANKVLCAVLSVENTTMAWAMGFRKLVVPGPEPLFIAGLPFDHARNAAVEQCLSRGCQYLFFLDSDVVAPPDAILRLIRHDKPIISGMYCRRSPPHAIPVMMRNHQWVTEIPSLGENPVVEVDLVGAGCLLIHRSLLERMAKECPVAPGKTWFHWRSDLHGIAPAGTALSEDYSFNYQVRTRLGIPILVDTSIRCRHIGLGEAQFGQFGPVGSLGEAA